MTRTAREARHRAQPPVPEAQGLRDHAAEGLIARRAPPMGTSPVYDEIGRSYTVTRRPDPRIARAIDAALGDARSVVNVGAGAGSYEPSHLRVTAVEPSPRDDPAADPREQHRSCRPSPSTSRLRTPPSMPPSPSSPCTTGRIARGSRRARPRGAPPRGHPHLGPVLSGSLLAHDRVPARDARRRPPPLPTAAGHRAKLHGDERASGARASRLRRRFSRRLLAPARRLPRSRCAPGRYPPSPRSPPPRSTRASPGSPRTSTKAAGTPGSATCGPRTMRISATGSSSPSPGVTALGQFASPDPLSPRLAAEPLGSNCHVSIAVAGWQIAPVPGARLIHDRSRCERRPHRRCVEAR